jgi:hypothetical protein
MMEAETFAEPLDRNSTPAMLIAAEDFNALSSRKNFNPRKYSNQGILVNV